MRVRGIIDWRPIDNWMKRGFIPYLKIGRTIRIRASAVNAFFWQNATRSTGTGDSGRHKVFSDLGEKLFELERFAKERDVGGAREPSEHNVR